MENYTVKGGKKLRYGYTTGSCATAAATAAAEMLFIKSQILHTKITLPQGETPIFSIENITLGDTFVIRSVKKDGGDDPDVTHGQIGRAHV